MSEVAPDKWIFCAVESAYRKVSIPNRYANQDNVPPGKKSNGKVWKGRRQFTIRRQNNVENKYVCEFIVSNLCNLLQIPRRGVLYTTAKAITSNPSGRQLSSMERYTAPEALQFEILKKYDQSDSLGRIRTTSGNSFFYISEKDMEKGVLYTLTSHRHRTRPDGVTVIEIIEVSEA